MRTCGEKKKIPVKREENHWTDFELRMVNDLGLNVMFLSSESPTAILLWDKVLAVVTWCLP